MQRALIHRHVRTIAQILFQYLEQPDLLRAVASILQTYERRTQAGLEADLEYLRVNQSRPGDAGLAPPSHVVELIQTLRNLYQRCFPHACTDTLPFRCPSYLEDRFFRLA